MDTDNRKLLYEFITHRSAGAFEELVRRHIRLVHGAALRQMKSQADAEDVTQSAFILLAQHAARIRNDEAVAGWLLTTTRHIAQNAIRAQSRRQRHEREAAIMARQNDLSVNAECNPIGPLLDQTLSELHRKDRDALTLRYLQGHPVAKVAEMMGTTQFAAQKRIGRALQKLKARFGQAGIHTTADAVASVLAGASLTAMPASLVSRIVHSSATSAVPPVTLTKFQIAAMTGAHLKAIAAVAVMAILIASTGAVVIHAMTADAVPAAATQPAANVSTSNQPRTAGTFRIEGAVQRPGLYSLDRAQISTLAAIIAAGGAADGVSPESISVRLTRLGTPNKPGEVIVYDCMPIATLMNDRRVYPRGLDVPLVDGDVITLVDSAEIPDDMVWGPTREGTLALHGQIGRCFDLETGRPLDLPQPFFPDGIKIIDDVSSRAFLDWCYLNGTDLLGNYNGADIVGEGMLTRESTLPYEAFTPREVREQLRNLLTQPTWVESYPGGGPWGKNVIIFRTRSGKPGRLLKPAYDRDSEFVTFQYSIGEYRAVH